MDKQEIPVMVSGVFVHTKETIAVQKLYRELFLDTVVKGSCAGEIGATVAGSETLAVI